MIDSLFRLGRHFAVLFGRLHGRLWDWFHRPPAPVRLYGGLDSQAIRTERRPLVLDAPDWGLPVEIQTVPITRLIVRDGSEVPRVSD
jgi:hypothetical protein